MILKEDKFLFREGDTGKALYIVRDGELQGTNTHNGDVNTYGPGDLVGELSLLTDTPCTETVVATDNCELQVIQPKDLDAALETEPSWLRSIIQFLTGRLFIAQNNKRKSDLIKALPSLLYILDSQSSRAEGDDLDAPLRSVLEEVNQLFNIPHEDVEKLLQTLEELELVKTAPPLVRIKNAKVVHLLYESIRFRARYRKTPPQILSMTEQTVLAAVIKTVQQSNDPLKNGTFTVKTPELLKVAHKSLHGITLTTRILMPLLQRNLLKAPLEIEPWRVPEIEEIPYFFGDFDTILDLMELNRIYPLLDRKLVNGGE